MTDYVKKLYSIEELFPGMEVGNDVLTDSGKIILREGTILTASGIEGLTAWDIASVTIREKVAPTPVITAESSAAAAAISKSQQIFCDQYNKTTTVIKQAFENMRYFKEAPLKEMQELASHSIFPMLDSIGVMNHLQMVHQQNDYTFQHSINVAIICGVLGKWLGYTKANLSDLVLAGLLHDIGKTQIPLHILDKPEKLSKDEMEIMRSHAVLGYKLIKGYNHLSSNVTYGVLQHHERMDGSGYPLQVKADQLHQYARIVAIADTYDAMTSDRVYRNKMTPFTVVETMNGEMFNKLDPHICTVFLNNVRNYFVGNIVKLDDGRRAEVVYLGPFLAARPTVCTQNGEFIDLEKHKKISIIELLEA